MQQPHVAGRLGDYLPCPAPVIDLALRRQRAAAGAAAAPRLGDLLLESRAVSAEQLRAAVEAQRVDRLRRCALFVDFSREDFARLNPVFEEVSVASREIIIEQGGHDTHLYVVATGELEVFRTDAEGEETQLAILGPGEPVGELGYLSGGSRTASVRTRTRCELLRTGYAELRRLFATLPQLSRAFLDVAVRRLVRTTLLYEQEHHQLLGVERTLRRLGEFLDLSAVAELGAGIDALMERLVHTASLLTDAERGSLFLLDETTGELWSKVAEGTGVREIRVPAGHGVVGWVAEQRELVNIRDAYSDPRFHHEADRQTGYRTRSILCAPLFSLDGKVLGVVQAVNKRRGSFEPADEQLIRAFAHQAAVAVENFHLHRRMMASHARIATLLEVATTVTGTLDLRSLVGRIVERTTEAMGCERSSFFVVDEDADELWSMESRGADLHQIRIPRTSGLAGHCACTGETLNVADAYLDPRFNPAVDARTGYRTRSVLCAPVIGRQGRVTGVVQCINRRQGGFDGDDETLLRAIASQLSVALDNAQLHTREVDMRRYLERVNESIESALVTLDDAYGVVIANRSASRLLPALEAQVPLPAVLGERNQPLLEMVDQAYATRAPATREGLSLWRDATEAHTVNASAVPLDGDDAAWKGLVLVMEDITRERRIKSAFSRYLAPAVVERLLEQPGELQLGGERREITALFTDIENFTGLSEQIAPEALVELLNRYFDRLISVVFDHGGTIDKIVGDSMHVLFNAPLEQPDHAERAVRCAIALDRASRALPAPGGGPALGRTRIGVNSGPCVVGNFGGRARFDYTAHGVAINLAARLEGANKYLGTRLCVGASTRAACPGLAFRPVGRLRVAGREAPVESFEPLDPSPSDPEALAAGVEAYLQAYALMAAGDAGAAEAFRRLAEHHPADPLARLHARRLAAGESGDVITLDGK